MTQSENTCALCQWRKADKTNSHVIPKFLCKTMLGSGNNKQAFTLNTDTLAQDTKFSQDTDKVDYLFCTECETYFSVLETYVATRINNRINNVRFDYQFTTETHKRIKWKVCKEVNPAVFRLFIYSIIFRCTLTPIGIFKKFKLKDSQLETLHRYLLHFHDINQTNVLNKIEQGAIA